MARQSTVVFLAMAFLLFVSLTQAARLPPFGDATTELKNLEKAAVEKLDACEGLTEEECLARRTLIAHTDYIYTQDGHN